MRKIILFTDNNRKMKNNRYTKGNEKLRKEIENNKILLLLCISMFQSSFFLCIFFSFMLYPAYSRVGRGNLM